MVSVNLDIKEEIAKLYKKKEIKSYALSQTRLVLGSLGESKAHNEEDAKDALQVVMEQMLLRVQKGKLVFPDDLNSPQAFLMENVKTHLKYYLLKRYVRRSQNKDTTKYQNELQRAKDEEKSSGEKFIKPSKYTGPRFDYAGDDDISGAIDIDAEQILESERIIPTLITMEVSEDMQLLIALRLEGYAFKEIAILQDNGESADALRMRYSRAMKDAGLDKSALK